MKKREHWSSTFGFILAASGSAVGLGSLWRFPYYAGENGGALFVLAYLFFTFFIGLPIFVAELVMGRSSQKSPVGAFSDLSGHKQNWKSVGYLCIFSSFIILSFYSVVAAWALNYALMSLCHWTKNLSAQEIRSAFDILYRSGDLSLFWHFVFILLNVGVVYGGVQQGIERWSRLLMQALFWILIGLFVYSSRLEGFDQAWRFVLLPNYQKFAAMSVLKALGMAFFTLSLGLGIVLTYGSYMKREESLLKTAFIICLLNVCVSLLASLVIFPIIFTFSLAPEEGPGLVFKTMPLLFERLNGGILLSSLFFFVLVLTAITSSISLLEVLVAHFIELFSWSRQKSTVIVGISAALMGVPSALAGSKVLFPNWELIYGRDFFHTISDTPDFLMPLGGLFISLFVGYFMDKRLVQEQFFSGSKWHFLFYPWYFSIRCLAPLGIVLIMIYQADPKLLASFFTMIEQNFKGLIS